MRAELGFSYRTSGQGEVRIFRAGREVTVLRHEAASRFLGKAADATPEALQQLCARVTGNYKRGNEATASKARGGGPR